MTAGILIDAACFWAGCRQAAFGSTNAQSGLSGYDPKVVVPANVYMPESCHPHICIFTGYIRIRIRHSFNVNMVSSPWPIQAKGDEKWDYLNMTLRSGNGQFGMLERKLAQNVH
ncbi:hypothetical protein [Sphingorhabdus sp.]|uniref:hypothetical protein n=1 Tax=Sphingorhabdus sp. TaxID=1902408 RepID=UPI00404720E4